MEKVIEYFVMVRDTREGIEYRGKRQSGTLTIREAVAELKKILSTTGSMSFFNFENDMGNQIIFPGNKFTNDCIVEIIEIKAGDER